MGRRKGVAAAVAAGLALWASPLSAAATTAPYDHDSEVSGCAADAGIACSSSADAGEATGRIWSSSSVTAPALAGGAAEGWGQANVTEIPKVPRSARRVDVTATVRVDAADASLAGAVPGQGNWAVGVLRLQLFAWCSGCVDGGRWVESTMVLVDTDPAGSAAPSSVRGEMRALQASIVLGPGERLDGGVFVTVQWSTRASLAKADVPLLERTAAASGDVTLAALDAVAS